MTDILVNLLTSSIFFQLSSLKVFVGERKKEERKKDILTSSKARIGPLWQLVYNKNGVFTHSSKVKEK